MGLSARCFGAALLWSFGVSKSDFQLGVNKVVLLVVALLPCCCLLLSLLHRTPFRITLYCPWLWRLP